MYAITYKVTVIHMYLIVIVVPAAYCLVVTGSAYSVHHAVHNQNASERPTFVLLIKNRYVPTLNSTKL